MECIYKIVGDIQGLIAVKPIDDFKSIYVTWMCTAPENNKMMVSKARYKGVGGHLSNH